MQAKIDIHEAENNILKKSLQDRDMRIQTLEKCINEYAGKEKDLQNSLQEANKPNGEQNSRANLGASEEWIPNVYMGFRTGMYKRLNYLHGTYEKLV